VRAYFIHTEGARTRLELREAPMPQPGAGQLLVKIRAASLNRGEFIAGHGLAKAGAKPAGIEAAGEVLGTGARVMGRCPGGFAEYGLMDEREAIPVPDALSWEEAAAAGIAFLTVHDMLIGQGQLKRGEWLLVTGVSSGVGVASLQAAKVLGARVIGTSGSKEKLARLAPLGLDVPLATRKPDFHDAVMQATGGHGADLVVNTVGGSVFAECVRVLAFQGRMATVGYVDGVMKAEMDIEALHARRLRLFGVSNKLRNAEQRIETVRGLIADLLPALADGRIKPLIDRVYAFEDLPAAKAYMESDAHVGKIIVRMP
jgi:NADPH:quinone reductase-like Zn-dependent oxidoreductase